MNELHHQIQHQQMRLLQLRLLLDGACRRRREPLRSLALSMVSHQTLLRGPGPLGFWCPDRKAMDEQLRLNDAQRQTAIIVSGMALGLVFKNAKGKLEVRS